MIKTIISRTTNKNDLLVVKEISDILNTIKEKDTVELEKLLDEELQSDALGKYYLLAVMRDIFVHFSNSNDEILEVESGSCLKNCYSNCLVYNLVGKKSGKSFSFVIEKQGNKIKGLHSCIGFLDSNEKYVPPSNDLQWIAWQRERDISGKNPGGYPEAMKITPEFVGKIIEISVVDEIKERFGTDVNSIIRK